MSFSIRTQQALLNSLFGKTSNFGALATAPTIYVGLSTADPGEDGSTLAEPSGSAYARVATTAADWNAATAAAPSVVNNANAITFPTATGAWGTCTYAVIFDASTAGNVLGSGALSASQSPTSGDTPSFSGTSLSITLT